MSLRTDLADCSGPILGGVRLWGQALLGAAIDLANRLLAPPGALRERGERTTI